MKLTNLTRRILPALLGLILFSSINAQDILLFEDFEDASVNYTTDPAEFRVSTTNYFTRTDGSNISPFFLFAENQGPSYFAAQAMASANLPVSMQFTADISNRTDLNFSILLAEDDDGTSQDWDSPDYVHIDYAIDGGTYIPLIHIRNDGSTFNSAPFIDTDFNNIGDGTEITSSFAIFSAVIPENGNSITIRIQINLQSKDEDIAFDNILLTGNINSDPGDNEPPVANCAASGTVTAELDQNGVAIINAESLDGGSTDNVGIASFEASPASFDCNQYGSQPVTLTVFDTNGNSSTCTTDVQVVDLLGPVISVNDNVVVYLDANGNVTLDENLFNNGSTDNCEILSVGVSPPTLSCSDAYNPNPLISDLIISEYVEGSGNNKYLEIYNGTGAAVDLADYKLDLFANGDFDPQESENLGVAGILQNGEAAVFSNPQASIYSGTHYSNPAINFNGNDVLVLYKNIGNGNYQYVDIFGTFENSPGSAWTSGTKSSANQTLRRNKTVLTGNTNDWTPSGTFLEDWENFAIDDVSDLGMHHVEDTPAQVTFSALDIHGNISTQSVSVQVIDNIAPHFITQPDDIIIPPADGFCEQSIWYTYPQVEDNCSSEVVFSSNHPPGSPFFSGETLVTITATDPSGNTDQVQFTVTIEKSPLTLELFSYIDYVCHYEEGLDGNQGTNIFAETHGGCWPYSYDWTDIYYPSSDRSVTTGGTYTLVVTDANGETATASITLTDNPQITFDVNQINPTCTVGNNGSLEIVNTDGGTGPYASGWYLEQLGYDSDFAFDIYGQDAVTGLEPGHVRAFVIDARDCWAFKDIIMLNEDVTPPTALCGSTTLSLDASGTAILDPSDLNNGSVDDCGTLSFSASQEIFDCTNLGDNEVILYVADDSLNTSTCVANVTIIDNLPPDLSVHNSLSFSLDNSGQVVIDASLFDNGSVDNCGITEYSVDPATLSCADIGEGPALATDLIISEYLEGSSTNKYIEIYNGTGSPIDLSDYVLRLYSNGASSVSASGSLSPAGTLADGQTALFKNSGTFINEGAGYSNAAVNFNGDDAIALYNTVTGQNVDIFGVIGTDPGSSWSAPGINTVNHTLRRLSSVTSGNTNPTNANFLDEYEQYEENDISGLGAHSLSAGGGTEITFTATDAEGNSSSTTVIAVVTDDSSPVFSNFPADITAESDPATCSAMVSWTEPTATDNCEATLVGDHISGETFPSGETTVTYTATDPSGNSVSQSFTITVVASEMTAEVIIDDQVHCNGGTAEVRANVTGGCQPYTFEWDGVSGTETQTVAAGDHIVTVMDVNGNVTTKDFSIDEPSALGITLDVTNPTCATASNGEITANVSGGIPSYSIIWSGDATGTGNTLSNVGNGTYTATATDIEGCTVSLSVTLNGQDNTDPTAICGNATVYLNEYGEAILDPGSIDLGSSDNCGNVVLSASQTYFDCSALGDNTVTLTVTDEAGHTSTCAATVAVTDTITPIFLWFVDDIVTTSDPGACSAVVTWEEPEALENCLVYILYDYSSGDTFPVGVTTVTYTATDLSGNSISESFTVTVLAEDLVVSLSANDAILCNGGSATISSAVTGGCEPYSYSWNGVSGSESLSANAGVHTLVVTDASGASASASITLVEPSAIVATLSATNPSCDQNADGSVSADVSGGTAPYTIEWSGDATGSGSSLSNIGNGTYTATVTDVNGCTASESISINGSDHTPPTAICGNATLYLDANGQATLDPADIDGGSWDNCGSVSLSALQTSFDCSHMGNNQVTLVVTDESGLTASCQATVTVVDTIAPVVTTLDIEVSLDMNGYAIIGISEINGGTTDNCGLASLEITSGQTEYGCEDIGQTFAVTLSAGDFSGNIGSSVAQVTVVPGGDSDGDGVSDACDICEGDDSLGDADGDGICDALQVFCPGGESITDPTLDCNIETTVSGTYHANQNQIYCINGPFYNQNIILTNGSTVRLSGSGILRLNIGTNCAVEIMPGSDISFNNITMGWQARGLVVHPDAEMTISGFAPSEPVVNCGTMNVYSFTMGWQSSLLNNGTINTTNTTFLSESDFVNNGTLNCDKFSAGYASSFVNNGEINSTGANTTNQVDGTVVNNGTIDIAGKLNLSYNGHIDNYCTMLIGKDFVVGRDVRNYALISVTGKSQLSYNGRVLLYDAAMYQTGSTQISGKYIGYGSHSLVKVLGITTSDWNGSVQGSIYFCDVNGIESISNPNGLTINGAVKSCELAMPISECNPIGHEVLPTPIFASSGSGHDKNDALQTGGDNSSHGFANPAGTQSRIDEITIYPNPTQGKARISFTPQFDSGVIIRIYSISGQKLEEFKPGDQIAGQPYEALLDITKYDNGVYFIQITDEERSETKKLVLAK